MCRGVNFFPCIQAQRLPAPPRGKRLGPGLSGDQQSGSSRAGFLLATDADAHPTCLPSDRTAAISPPSEALDAPDKGFAVEN